MVPNDSKSDLSLNQKKIKGVCQSGGKVVPHDSKSDLPLVCILRKKGTTYLDV